MNDLKWRKRPGAHARDYLVVMDDGLNNSLTRTMLGKPLQQGGCVAANNIQKSGLSELFGDFGLRGGFLEFV